MHMREKSNEAQDGDYLELQLVRLVRHPLRQSMQPKEQDAEHQNGEHQEYAHRNHEHVGFAWSGDERWEMMGSRRVKRILHVPLLPRPGALGEMSTATIKQHRRSLHYGVQPVFSTC
jgi:hypothetical protein